MSLNKIKLLLFIVTSIRKNKSAQKMFIYICECKMLEWALMKMFNLFRKAERS